MTYPTLNITTNGKNRVKQTNEVLPKVYLENNTEFGLELFNPTSDVLLAKIEINGKLISNSGLIIKPGERAFLDRYIDKNDKFKFTSYEVESNNADVDNAIQWNGYVKVHWYKEKPKSTSPLRLTLSDNGKVEPYTVTWTNFVNPLFETTCTGGNVHTTLSSASDVINTTHDAIVKQMEEATKIDYSIPLSFNVPEASGISTSCYCNSISSTNINGECVTNISSVNYKDGKLINEDNKTLYKKTGRVEKGSKSEQELEFNYDYIFENSFSYTNVVQLLPIENKPLTVKELAERPSYCTNCGKKLHKKYKFCPCCGTKVE